MHRIARTRYSHRDPRPYLQFLQDCIAECDREHSPEEVAAAAERLAMPARPRQPGLDLQGRAA